MGKDRKKDKALELLVAGKVEKARDLLKKILAGQPDDFRLWLRLGDCYRKLEQKAEAVDAYLRAANGFAKAGFLVQAIASLKQVLEIKPDDETIQEELAELYAQRGMTYRTPAKEAAPEDEVAVDASAEADAPQPEEPLEVEESAPASVHDDPARVTRSMPPATEPETPVAPVPIRVAEEDTVQMPVAGEAADAGEADAVEEANVSIEPAGRGFDVPLLSDLDARELHTLIEELQRSERKQGEIVFREGDEGDSLFLISRGRVGVFTGEFTDAEDLLAVLGEGEFFGEFALLTNHHRQASVIALDDVELLEVSQAVFKKVVEAHPRVREVAQEYYRRRVLDNLQNRCALFRSLPPEERERVIGLGERKVFLEGTPILREGMRGEALFVIADGEVEVRVDFGDGELNLARLGPGEFFGEVSALTGNPCTADVFAVSRVEVVAFERERAAELAATFPSIRRILTAFGDRRLHRTLGRLEAALEEKKGDQGD